MSHKQLVYDKRVLKNALLSFLFFSFSKFNMTFLSHLFYDGFSNFLSISTTSHCFDLEIFIKKVMVIFFTIIPKLKGTRKLSILNLQMVFLSFLYIPSSNINTSLSKIAKRPSQFIRQIPSQFFLSNKDSGSDSM